MIRASLKRNVPHGTLRAPLLRKGGWGLDLLPILRSETGVSEINVPRGTLAQSAIDDLGGDGREDEASSGRQAGTLGRLVRQLQGEAPRKVSSSQNRYRNRSKGAKSENSKGAFSTELLRIRKARNVPRGTLGKFAREQGKLAENARPSEQKRPTETLPRSRSKPVVWPEVRSPP